jgi:hypothetical protein
MNSFVFNLIVLLIDKTMDWYQVAKLKILQTNGLRGFSFSS